VPDAGDEPRGLGRAGHVGIAAREAPSVLRGERAGPAPSTKPPLIDGASDGPRRHESHSLLARGARSRAACGRERLLAAVEDVDWLPGAGSTARQTSGPRVDPTSCQSTIRVSVAPTLVPRAKWPSKDHTQLGLGFYLDYAGLLETTLESIFWTATRDSRRPRCRSYTSRPVCRRIEPGGWLAPSGRDGVTPHRGPPDPGGHPATSRDEPGSGTTIGYGGQARRTRATK
jgi:hypothetical protein